VRQKRMTKQPRSSLQKGAHAQAHTQGVGDESYFAGALDFLGRSRLMCLPRMTPLRPPGRSARPDLLRRELHAPALVAAVQLASLQVSFCATAARVRARTPTHAPARARQLTVRPPDAVQAGRTLSFTMHPASDAVTRVLDLEGRGSW
jgi:hypothetical protein